MRTFFAVFVSGLMIFPACAGTDGGSSGPLGRGAEGGSGNAGAGGSAQGGTAQGGSAQGGTAQGGSTQGGSTQGGTAGDAGSAGTGNAGAGGSGNAGAGGSGAGGAGGSGNAGAGGSGAGTCTSPSGLGTCDTWTQCGCNAGQMCQIRTADGTTSCYPAGSGVGYGTCSNSDGCGIGYDCVGGICQQYCDVDNDCAGSYDVCSEVGTNASGTFTPIPGFKTCSRTCDPTNAQNTVSPYQACASGLACVAVGDDTSLCTVPGSAGHHGSCATNGQDDCAAGMLCLGTECLRTCLNVNGSCSGGETCYGVTYTPTGGSGSVNLTVAGTQVGVCDI